ncbi:hypothetical protein D3C72_882570 [compost metagenome]
MQQIIQRQVSLIIRIRMNHDILGLWQDPQCFHKVPEPHTLPAGIELGPPGYTVNIAYRT